METETLRETDSFKLIRAGGKYRVQAKPSNVTPRSRMIRADTAEELLRYSDESFDGSCVWDLGVGVFEKK
jgi:hypothetical protein